MRNIHLSLFFIVLLSASNYSLGTSVTISRLNPALIATRLFNECLLGRQSATFAYTERLNEFLNYCNIKDVLIKKMEPFHIAKQLLVSSHKATHASLGGIWLDEEQLDQMKESELIFTFALAATFYAKFNLKDYLIDAILCKIPATCTLMGNAAILSLSDSICADTEPRSMIKLLTKNVCISFIISPATFFGYKWHKKFNRLINNKQMHNLCSQVKLTTKLLRKHGYGWVIEDYIRILKERITNNKVLSGPDASLNDQQLCTFLEKCVNDQTGKPDVKNTDNKE